METNRITQLEALLALYAAIGRPYFSDEARELKKELWGLKYPNLAQEGRTS